MTEERNEIKVDPEKERVLNDMRIKAKEIHTFLQLSGKDYTLDDYLSFGFINFINSTNMIPQFMAPVKYMLNLYIDGVLQMEEMRLQKEHGILSIKK
jgi:hypothetical protein